MSETVKLIIEIPKGIYEMCKDLWVNDAGTLESAVAHGIPLDSNSEKAEVQAYFAGQTYGWEQGRKDLCDKISAEIDEKISHYEHFSSSNTANGLMIAKKIIEKYKGDKE